MTSLKEDVVGFFEEPTTYKHDFCVYPTPSKPTKEAPKRPATRNAKGSKPLKTITSYDTLQKLDYMSRLPFDTMLRPKEILGTNPQQTFCQRIEVDEGLEEAIKTRPRQYVSPGISLDNVEDPATRKLMVDFTYMTTTSRAVKEAWSDFHPVEPSLPNTVFEKMVDPLALRLQLLPDIPAGFQSAARKWDRIQERYQVNTTAEFWKNRQKIDYEKRLSNLISPEDKTAVRTLLRENKLRLSYDRMPLSYGGFRPRFAMGVPLEAKESSPYDPNLSVARAITARLTAI